MCVYNCIKCGQNALDFGEYDGMQRHAFILDFHFASRKEISFEGESLNEFGRRKKWPKPCQHEHELQRPSQPHSSPGAAEIQRWNGVVAAKLKQLTFFNLPHGSSW